MHCFEDSPRLRDLKASQHSFEVKTNRLRGSGKIEKTACCRIVPAGVIHQSNGWIAINAAAYPSNRLYGSLQFKRVFSHVIASDEKSSAICFERFHHTNFVIHELKKPV